jgi:hypothetical protein
MILASLLVLGGSDRQPSPHIVSLPQAIQAPVLKWQHGGCDASWCETAWYSSPAVADLDNNGTMEVIGAAYSLFILNGENGSEQTSVGPIGGRVWPGIVVSDLDGDSDLEIVTAHGGGYVHVFDHTGKSLWSLQPTTSEIRGLKVFDLDGDGTMEIIVTAAVTSSVNTWVYEHDGSVRPGWPQLSTGLGSAYGVFNDNSSVGDLDGDGNGEIIVPSDVTRICAYEANGDQIAAHSMYGDKYWGEVSVWESLNTEIKGWGLCDGTREESYRTNFAHGASVMADVDGDGVSEVIVTGNVYDCAVGHPPGIYNGVYIFNADRSRFYKGSYDWRTPPVDTGAPLSEDYTSIENCMPNPAVADIDGDGKKEIIYSSYDGRVHAFWLDKTEHGNWPYSVYNAADGFYRFSSEPTVADLDNNGYAEVIIASWVQKGTTSTGKLHILSYQGDLLHEIDLPSAFGVSGWNGSLAAPTLANIDSDPDLEVVVNTAYSGIVAYDLPNTASARILWGTGRGNFERTGSIAPTVPHFKLSGSWTGAGHGTDGWYVGDFNGDKRDDIFRYMPGVSGAQVFLSDGTKFVYSGSWTGAGHGTDGWYVGDFNKDGRDDIFRYVPGVSGAQVFLSDGTKFVLSGSWTGAGHGTDGWYVGDFNGDGRDDIFRYVAGVSGAQVFLSDGTKFVAKGSWTGAGHGSDGWYVGDFNGGGRDDIFRYLPGVSGAQVFLSDGTKFVLSGSWTGAGHGSDGWYVGDFNGGGRDDIFRYMPGVSGAQVFLSDGTKFVYSGSWTDAGHGTDGWYVGDFSGDGRDDIFRYVPGTSGAQVFLATN